MAAEVGGNAAFRACMNQHLGDHFDFDSKGRAFTPQKNKKESLNMYIYIYTHRILDLNI